MELRSTDTVRRTAKVTDVSLEVISLIKQLYRDRAPRSVDLQDERSNSYKSADRCYDKSGKVHDSTAVRLCAIRVYLLWSHFFAVSYDRRLDTVTQLDTVRYMYRQHSLQRLWIAVLPSVHQETALVGQRYFKRRH